MATTFHLVAADGPTFGNLQFCLPPSGWERGMGREWGVDGDNFPLSCSADGPSFGTFAFLGSPFWTGEGDGEGVGSGW